MLKIAYAPIYKYDLPSGHRFPMEKYELLPEQLLYEGTVEKENFFAPEAIGEDLILLTHEKTYWEKLKFQTLSYKEARAIGFPISRRLVERGRYIARGTIDCALYAIEHGVALNIAGGTHHSFSYKGEGFCLLNDIAIAANYLLQTRKARQILVIDLDVHQGNGTAQIFTGDRRVFTFSMHGEKNYPLRKERSDLDIGLPDGTEDDAYLKILRDALPRLLHQTKPDFIFYLAGADVLATDKLGRLGLSIRGCRQRDQTVLEFAREKDIPLAISMGGGYSVRIRDIIEAHANTFRVAKEVFF